MDFTLKGGALIIGSLYWQDHRDDADTIRKDWRTQELMMISAIDVKVPIKYGRFSKEEIYTMIFDNKLSETHFGVGKAVPFSTKIFRNFNQIKEKVGSLSNVEGRHDGTFIKGRNDNSKAWCVCGILFNPNIEKSVKSYLLEKWETELKVNKAGYKKFISATEKYSLSKQGELLIHWPENASGFDFLIATSTQPKLRKGVKALTPMEIANHIGNRSYFFPNRENGITTFQDDEILKALLNGWPFSANSRKELVEYLPDALNYYGRVEAYYKGLSFIEAVEQAAKAQVPSDSTSCSKNKTAFASHQNRVGKKKCEEGADMLSTHPYWNELEKAESFEDIFKVTEQVKHKTLGLGDLWSYDTAQRIALHQGWYPKDVYLQSGAYHGIQILRDKGFIDSLTIKGKRHLSVKAMPEFLSKLEPFLIENILCVGKRKGWFK